MSNQLQLFCMQFTDKMKSVRLNSGSVRSAQISCRKAAKLLCYTLLALSLIVYADSKGAPRNCSAPIVGTYRDCLCGLMWRDVETHCQDDFTYYQPILTQENLTCPFQCLNGGVFVNNKRCNCGQKAHGLCCETPTPYCGEVHLKPTGEIKSPGYDLFVPPSYLPNADCIWKISTDEDRQIALGLVEDNFDIEPGSTVFSCDYDHLTVYDGDSVLAPTFGIFCGNINSMRAFKTIYSTGRHLYLVFKSNSQKESKGFHLQYRTFLKGTKCGPRTTFSLPIGLIPSPNYPIKYRPNESCEYTIEVKPGHDLILKTLDLNIPSELVGAEPPCGNGTDDRILVLKKTTSSKLYDEVEAFCGKDPFPSLIIRGASSVLIKFTSNSVREGRFLLQYEQVPI